ncbi:hypothetical protein AC249_AIPGENE23977 [Exaiptasia diaphana]|nr:hypothetical protein AC249_AIPGENE23977 [Exaiptasia diaphana]
MNEPLPRSYIVPKVHAQQQQQNKLLPSRQRNIVSVSKAEQQAASSAFGSLISGTIRGGTFNISVNLQQKSPVKRESTMNVKSGNVYAL